jgi:uncharacterized membrane protein
MEALFRPRDDGDLRESPLPAYDFPVYSLMFLPQAVGVTLGRLLQASNLLIFYLGRLFNLLFYALILGAAIRVIPRRFKAMGMLLALMPMAMHQAASYSYDVFINALSFLQVAYILRFALEDGLMRKKDFWGLLALSLILAPAKSIYAFLSLLVFIIPKEKYRNGKAWWLQSSVITAGSILTTFLFTSWTLLSAADAYASRQFYTFDFALLHPLETVIIFMRTVYTQAVFWGASFLGVCLSGLTLIVPGKFLLMYLFLLIASIFPYKDELNCYITSSRRIFMLSVCAFVSVLAMASMFFGWTPMTAQVILGVQGRYFIPLALPAMAALSNHIMVYRRKFKQYMPLAGVLVNVAVIHSIFAITKDRFS